MKKRIENIIIIIIATLYAYAISTLILFKIGYVIFSDSTTGAGIIMGLSYAILRILLLITSVIFIVRYWKRPILSIESNYVWLITLSIIPLIYLLIFVIHPTDLALPLGHKLRQPILCKMIMDDNRKNVCYQDLAIIKKDFSLCSSIKEQTHSPELNELFTDSWRERCHIYVSIAKKETTYCGNMADNSCVSTVAGLLEDASYCNNLSSLKRVNLESDQDECFFWASAQSGNKEFCPHINDLSFRKKCEAL